jgi:pantothenate kinase
MAAAIDTACKLMSGGASVFQIVGSDGFMMERRDIEIECLRRRKGNPQIKT